VILVISFVIALVSMVRERKKVFQGADRGAPAGEELFGAGQKSAPVTPDIVEKPELNEAPLTEAPVYKTGSFPGVQGDQPSQILHPKNAITIGAGLRANLNNTVSLRDLKK